jgi:hypothetical protein
MYTESTGDRVCLQCGERVCSEDTYPYYISPSPEHVYSQAYDHRSGKRPVLTKKTGIR